MKKKALVKLPPKRLAPHLSRTDLELVRKTQLADRIAEKSEEERKRDAYHSEKFDIFSALRAFRTPNDIELGGVLIGEVAACVTVPHRADVAASMMKGLKPRSAIEVLLLSQMAGTHFVGMKELSQAAQCADQETADLHTARAIRLLRTFTMQVEALDMLRNKGRSKQRIDVRHVNVGTVQALVGVRGT